MRHRHRPTLNAFTLVELLVVIAIIGVLVALLLPAVQAAREAARRSQCTNNLKQMALACQNHMSTYGGDLPVGYAGKPTGNRNFNKKGLFSEMLPFMEEQNTYDSIDFDYAADPFVDPMANRVIDGYVCASWSYPVVYSGQPNGYENGAYVTYAGVAGATTAAVDINDRRQYIPSGFGGLPRNGAFVMEERTVPNSTSKLPYGIPRRGAQITDGQSNSLLIGEFVDRICPVGGACQDPPGYMRPWIYAGFVQAPYSIRVAEQPPGSRFDTIQISGVAFNHRPFGSEHAGGIVQFAFVDGSVQVISNSTELDVFQALATVSGSEVVNALP